MQNVSLTLSQANDKLDKLSADLASSVYQVTLRNPSLAVGLILNSICGKRSPTRLQRTIGSL